MKRYIPMIVLIVLIICQLPALAQSPDVKFSAINANGRVHRTEADEWIEIQNLSGWAVNLSGWSITANDGQRFHFPANATIQPNQKCRLYTNQNHGGCSFNWGSGSARWNNEGDCGRLYNNGQVVDTFCYSGGADDGTPQYPSSPNPAPNPSPQPQPTPQTCPTDGAWPPGCIPGGSPSQPTQPPTGGQPCPSTGSWPRGCIPGGSPSQPAGQPCPTSGAWPSGCIPGGASPQPSGGEGQPCPTNGTWPSGCIPTL